MTRFYFIARRPLVTGDITKTYKNFETKSGNGDEVLSRCALRVSSVLDKSTGEGGLMLKSPKLSMISIIKQHSPSPQASKHILITTIDTR